MGRYDESVRRFEDAKAVLAGGVSSNFRYPLDIASGRVHSCIILDTERLPTGLPLRCWGYRSFGNREGQLEAPVTLSNPTAVFAGDEHSCAIDDSGLTCWGAGMAGSPI